MADVDFDQIEAVLEGRQPTSEKTIDATTDSSSRARTKYDDDDHDGSRGGSRRRSRSRSRRRDHSRSSSRRHSRHHRGGRSSRSWESGGDARRGSSRQSRSHRAKDSQSPGYQERRRISMERREAELREQKMRAEYEKKVREEEEKRKRELDEARRDDLTVLILNLNLKATERDVWKFFSEKAGKVRDIQIIRDSRSGKSKGVGYVEFYSPQSVLQALALSGSYILDVPIVVQASQAEKNRAAKAAKQQAAEITEGGPMKVYVGGLVDALNSITEADLKQLFSPFGEIVDVDVHKDPYTGRCKGYGFVQFRHAQDAREAMAAMNGFDIGGQQIKVGYATDPSQRPLAPLTAVESLNGVPLGSNLAAAQHALQNALMFADAQTDNERLDDEGGGLLSGVNPRISLMQKLQRLDQQTPSTTTTTAAAAASAVPSPAATGSNASLLPTASSNVSSSQVSNAPPFSCNICLETLFSASDIPSEEGESFLDDVAEDVRSECTKYGVVMQVWINRKNVDGKVWVKFGGPDQAVKAHQALNGRYFAGNRISVAFIAEPVWQCTCVV